MAMMFGALLMLVRTWRFRTLWKRRKRGDAAAQKRERAYEKQDFAREPHHTLNIERRPGPDKARGRKTMRDAVLSAARNEPIG